MIAFSPKNAVAPGKDCMTVLTDIHSVPSGPHRTHEVTNQAPPRVDRNEFADNTALVEAVDLFVDDRLSELHEIGRHGHADYQRDAPAANNHPRSTIRSTAGATV